MIRDAWNAAWNTPATAFSLRMTRTLLVLQALWILSSRPDVPWIVTWPRAFFPDACRLEYWRYGIFRGGVAIEWALYGALAVVLLLVACGVATRVTCLTSGLLLYHFAPFEEIIAGMPHTHFGGLTIPCAGLLILGFAEQPRDEVPSAEYRWPLTLIQLLFTFIYEFAFFGKLRYGHLGWFTASNIRAYCLHAWALTRPPLAYEIAQQAWLCWVIAIGTLFFESLSPLAVFSRAFRRVWVPAAVLFHVGSC